MAAKSSVPSTSDKQIRKYSFKILIIGEIGTGKTAVVKRYVHSPFIGPVKLTIGLDFEVKMIKYDDDTVIRLELWDIPELGRLRKLSRIYCKDVVGCIIVFDVTRSSTFDAVAKWKFELDDKIQLQDGSRVPCILLANKCDLPKDNLINNTDQMNDYCREKEFDKWFETSAKANININTSIKYLIDEIMKRTNELSALQQATLPEPSAPSTSSSCF